MKLRSLIQIAFLLLLFVQAGCGKKAGSGVPDEDIADFYNGELTTVWDHTPQDGQDNVAVNAKIVIQFTGPIDPSTVSTTSLQVFDSRKQPVEGFWEFSTDNTAIRWTRKVGGHEGVLTRNEKYTVTTHWIRNNVNRMIPTYTFEFNTGDNGASDSEFRIVKFSPSKATMGPGTPIEIQFSEPLNIQPYMLDTITGNYGCSRTTWAGVINVTQESPGLISGRAGVTPVSGQICLVCKQSQTSCDKLQFWPDFDYEWGSSLTIIVRGNEHVEGAITGGRLDKDFIMNKIRYITSLN